MISYFNSFVCLAAELQCMSYTEGIRMHLHFYGFAPFIYTSTVVHVLLAVITHPVRGRVFPLPAYSGTAKLNGLFNGLNRPYTGKVAINAWNGKYPRMLSHLCFKL